MMEQREKLIDILSHFHECLYDDAMDCNECDYKDVDECCIARLADYLLANGVLVLPCRCKECKYSYRIDDSYRVCRKYHYQKLHDESQKNNVADYWFCADGERKGGDE